MAVSPCCDPPLWTGGESSVLPHPVIDKVIDSLAATKASIFFIPSAPYILTDLFLLYQ